jgi:hypothetical protein
MAQLTPEQKRNVQRRLKQLLESMTEDEIVQGTGIPQATVNAAHRKGKIGFETARRIADYLAPQGETLETILSGTTPAGYYLPQDMNHPLRGRLLDGLRGSVPKEILDEVAAIETPEGGPSWTLADWLEEVRVRVSRAERMGNVVRIDGGKKPHGPGQR